MPLYQMVCIGAHYSDFKHIKDLVRQTALHVLHNGGVVRKLSSWGTLSLPQRMKRNKQYHVIGDYWTMDFDASPRTLMGLNSLMRHDPRVIRWTMLKQGEKIEDVVEMRGKTQST